MTTAAILLSIHPRHGEAILDGSKRFEFRRRIPRFQVGRVVMYQTMPVGRVVGEFECGRVLSLPPVDLWEVAGEHGGVSREEFFAYFGDRKIGHALEVTAPKRYAQGQMLGSQPPQSWRYLKGEG